MLLPAGTEGPRACARGSAGAQQLEAQCAVPGAAAPWRISEQLRRASASFAPPLIRRLDDAGRVQRPPKTRLVQSTPEQDFVDGLQLAQCERARQQSERDRFLIHSHAERMYGGID